MHRLSRRDLDSRLFVTITTAPPTIQRGLLSKDQQTREAARKGLAALLCDQIDGAGICVVQAARVRVPGADIGCGTRAGRFGEDEPWPAPIAD